MTLSIISPVYEAENSLDELIIGIVKAIADITNDYEIILVEDGSSDGSWKKIENICHSNTKVKGIKLSRNFGQHNAITAGLSYSKGEWIIVMDCDFQDNPKYIPVLYNEAMKGYDIVFAKRINRTDGRIRKLYSKFFYKIFSWLTDSDFDGSIGNYGIYHRKTVNAILSMKEPFKFFRLMAEWVGFHTTTIEVLHGERRKGKSSYTYAKLISLALTVVLTYSQKPLLLTVKLGLFISLLSLLFALYNIIYWYLGKITVLGYASLITSVWFMSGMIIFTLGILGLYLGKTFEGITNRPVFIVDKTIN